MPVQDILAQASDILSKTQGEGALTSLGKGITQGVAIAESFEKAAQNRELLKIQKQQLEEKYIDKGFDVLTKMGDSKITPKTRKILADYYVGMSTQANQNFGKSVLPPLTQQMKDFLLSEDGVKFQEKIRSQLNSEFPEMPTDPTGVRQYVARGMQLWADNGGDPTTALDFVLKPVEPALKLATSAVQGKGLENRAAQTLKEFDELGGVLSPEQTQRRFKAKSSDELAGLAQEITPRLNELRQVTIQTKLQKENPAITPSQARILSDPMASKEEKAQAAAAVQMEVNRRDKLEEQIKRFGMADKQASNTRDIFNDADKLVKAKQVIDEARQLSKIAKEELAAKGSISPGLAQSLGAKLLDLRDSRLSVIKESELLTALGDSASLLNKASSMVSYVFDKGRFDRGRANAVLGTLDRLTNVREKSLAPAEKAFRGYVDSQNKSGSLPKEAYDSIIGGFPKELRPVDIRKSVDEKMAEFDRLYPSATPQKRAQVKQELFKQLKEGTQ